jgi:hypothetical protein
MKAMCNFLGAYGIIAIVSTFNESLMQGLISRRWYVMWFAKDLVMDL